MRRLVLIAVAVVAFVLVAGGLARFLTTEGNERDLVRGLLKAQARGDANAMLGAMAPSCRRDARCRATVTANARRLARPGDPKIIAYDSATSYSLGAATGRTRVAWTVVNRGLPVVQCITVRRSGTVLAGRRVSLLRLSAPIDNESSC